MSSDPEKVLILAKEAAARSYLRRTLEALGFDVGEAANGEDAMRRMRMVDYEAILLECRMFGSDFASVCNDCASVCKQLGILYPGLPILVISSEREFAARLRSTIWHFHTPVIGTAERSAVGEIVLDPARHRVEKAGSRVSLTPTEFSALQLLMQQPGIPISHSTLIAAIWGQESIAKRQHLRVVIGALRKKLEDNPSKPRYLTTSAYFGYCFSDQ
jgi:two-component system KDP operon response regulator KdpE